jgi:hypothetical protein
VTTDISRLELSAAVFSFKITQRGVHDLDLSNAAGKEIRAPGKLILGFK